MQLTVRSDGRSEAGPESGRHPNITGTKNTQSHSVNMMTSIFIMTGAMVRYFKLT